MRRLAPALPLFLLATTCSLVIGQRTDDYEGACADEEEALDAEYRDGEPVGGGLRGRTVEQIARDCRGCGEEDCVEDCIQEETGDAVSFECAACYADATLCMAQNCSAVCPLDAVLSQACIDCGCDAGCSPDFDACSGLERSPCDE